MKGNFLNNAMRVNATGFSYDQALNDQWRISFSSDARFTSDYDWTATLDPFEQDSFWILDAAVSTPVPSLTRSTHELAVTVAGVVLYRVRIRS